MTVSDPRQVALEMVSAADDHLTDGWSYALCAVVMALIYIGDQIGQEKP